MEKRIKTMTKVLQNIKKLILDAFAPFSFYARAYLPLRLLHFLFFIQSIAIDSSVCHNLLPRKIFALSFSAIVIIHLMNLLYRNKEKKKHFLCKIYKNISYQARKVRKRRKKSRTSKNIKEKRNKLRPENAIKFKAVNPITMHTYLRKIMNNRIVVKDR